MSNYLTYVVHFIPCVLAYFIIVAFGFISFSLYLLMKCAVWHCVCCTMSVCVFASSFVQKKLISCIHFLPIVFDQVTIVFQKIFKLIHF